MKLGLEPNATLGDRRIAVALVLCVPAMRSQQIAEQQTVQQAQALAQKIAQQTAQKPLMAEEVFKNVQILKGIPVNQFMDTMGFFAASLGLNCVYCHVAGKSGELGSLCRRRSA